MKTRLRLRHFILFFSVFIFLFIFSFIFKFNSYAGGDDIDIERLTRAASNANAGQKFDKIKNNPGANPGANPGIVNPGGGNQIPGNAIVTDLANGTQPLVGTGVKVRVKPGLTFGNGNIRSATLKWITGDGTMSQPLVLPVQGGMVANFNGAFYEFRPAAAGPQNVRFEITYKVFGDSNDHNAASPPENMVFVAGGANPGGNPGAPGAFVPPPPGQNTPPGTVSQQIPINFARAGGPPEIKERESYTWSWPHPQLQHPTSNPGKAYSYIINNIKRGSEIETDEETGIDGNAHSALSENEKANYIEFGGTYYRKRGINIDGDGPLPDSLNPKWEVRYPSVSPNGSGGWNVAHNLTKTTAQGDNFTYSMPEPCEPFKAVVAMKVKHTWRDYSYDKAGCQLQAAIQFYTALKSNTDPTGVYNNQDKYKDVTITANLPSCSGGVGQAGPLPITITISASVTFMEKVKVGTEDDNSQPANPDGSKPQKDKFEWQGLKNGTISKNFNGGKVKHDDDPDKFTDESIVHELVLDTTAPRIEFAPQTIGGMANLAGSGDIICSSGDLINVRVKVTDNNRYCALRTPYLTYETAPSGNNPAGAPWSAVPLMMEPCAGVPDNTAPRPFTGGNWGYFQALVPAPHNIKGSKALRWFVDAFDGAKFQQPQQFNGVAAFGNFNHGNFQYDGVGPNTHHVAPSPANTGTLSIYDNDRPNINVKMWKVDRAGNYLVGEFEAAEDYFTEDFYYDMTNPSNIVDPSGPAGEFKAKIPVDTAPGNVPAAAAILGPNSAGSQIPGALIFPNSVLFPAAKKTPIAENLKFQIEDSSYNFFKYQAGFGAGGVGGLKDGGCAVVFEDVKYIFTVDAFDNIEGLANNGVVTMIPRPERTKVSFELKDDTAPALAAVNMEFRDGQSAAVTSANEGKLWYLGPEDPSIPTPAGAPIPKEVPTFEHVFHSVSADNSVGNRYMKIAATDRCGHKRHLAIHFKVSEVTNELRVLEEKIKRELKAQKDK